MKIDEPALWETCKLLTSKKGKKALLEAIKLGENEIKEWQKIYFRRSSSVCDKG